MEIFSFFQNLQLLAFGQKLTQGNQENQVTAPVTFETLMAGLESQEEQGEHLVAQPEVPFVDNDTPKVMTSDFETLRTFQPMNVSSVPEKFETKTEEPSPSFTWKNLFADNRRVSDVPAVKDTDVPDDVDFDDGVVADDSEPIILKSTPETPQPERKADSVDVKTIEREPNVPEIPEPVADESVEVPEIVKPEIPEPDKAEEVPERPTLEVHNTEPHEASRPIEATKPEAPEMPASKSESSPVVVNDDEKKAEVTEPTVQPKSLPETEQIMPKKIELTDSDVPETPRLEVPHEEPELPQEAEKPLKPSEVKTVEKVSFDDEETDLEEIPETPREVREVVDEKPNDKQEVRQPQTAPTTKTVETAPKPREVAVKADDDSEEPKVVECREIPEVKAVDNTEIRKSDIEEPEESEAPKEIDRPVEAEKPEKSEKPEESPEVPEAPDTAVIMAGFAAVQTTPQTPTTPDAPASESPDVPVSTRSERPRNTPRTTRNSQEVESETREQTQPQIQTRSTKSTETDNTPEKSPEPQVRQQKTSPNEPDNEAPVSTTSSTTPTPSTSTRATSTQSTTRASRTTERTETRRASNIHSDFQSFFDSATRTRRTSSTARANAQPLSLRTSTYTEQPQAPTLRNGIVNVVRFIRTDGVRKANIIVDPPAIGRISVELTSSSSGVEASIKVASEQIRQILQNQVTQLRDNLLQQGVQVSEFTVDVQQDNSQQGQNSENGNRQNPYNFTAGVNEDDDTEDFRIDLEEGLLYWIA